MVLYNQESQRQLQVLVHSKIQASTHKFSFCHDFLCKKQNLFTLISLLYIQIFQTFHDIKISFLSVGNFQKQVRHSYLRQMFLLVFQGASRIIWYSNYNRYRRHREIHINILYDAPLIFKIQMVGQITFMYQQVWHLIYLRSLKFAFIQDLIYYNSEKISFYINLK